MSNVYRLWSSEARRREVGNVGDQERALLRIYLFFEAIETRCKRREQTCITTLRSAFPVRISYSVNVRSEPILPRTEDSLKLKRTAVIVSVEVGKVRFDIGALLGSSYRSGAD